MAGFAAADQWPIRWRMSAAVAAGLVWALLWIGLDRLGTPNLVFWLATLILLSPIIPAISRTWRELATLGAVAFLIAIVAAYVLLGAIQGSLLLGSEVAMSLFPLAAAAWIPIAALAVLLYIVKAAGRRRR